MPPQPPQVFSLRGLRLYFPALEPWVLWSASLPRCSSPFIYAQMWGRGLGLLAVALPAPFVSQSTPSLVLPATLCPGYWSPPLLQVWMNVSSLSPWLLDFHVVQFSVSSGCFLFLNCFCASFGCVRRRSVSTYASILARSP